MRFTMQVLQKLLQVLHQVHLVQLPLAGWIHMLITSNQKVALS